METFSVRLTEISFNKWRLKLVNILTLSFGLPIFLVLLYFDITGYIPFDLKIAPFLGQAILTILVLFTVSFVLLYFTIKTADKSYDGTFQINDHGLRFDLGTKIRQIPWTFVKKIETPSEEWRIETKKKVFWVKFTYNYERYKAGDILKAMTDRQALVDPL